MTTKSRVFANTAQTTWQRAMLFSSFAQGKEATPAEWYQMLEAYYLNNGLYDGLAELMRNADVWMEGMKPIRNPANRAVEFHVAHLWPGALPQALPMTANKEAVLEAVRQVWAWSNWGTRKQLAGRKFAALGDLFIKVPSKTVSAETVAGDPVQEVTQVFMQLLHAPQVTDFTEDERGYLTSIRIDKPVIRESGGRRQVVTYTEVWDKPSGMYLEYEHKKAPGTALKELGRPKVELPIRNYGFDFIPIVHAKFRDVGEKRGAGCFVHTLDKIDEANRMATRLHQILFRYGKPVIGVMANATDQNGRPLPPPRMTDRSGNALSDGESASLGDDDIWEFPGMSKAEYLIPTIQYDSALSILNGQMEELHADLPEILYYELKDKGGDLSGVALEKLLAPAVDRVIEARGNAESALVRAQQMALTIGQIHGLPGFEVAKIGTYENGDFAHVFAQRPVLALGSKERAETIKTDTEAGMSLEFAMAQRGYSAGEIAENRRLLEEEAQRNNVAFGQAVLDAARRFDQNGNGGQ